MSSKAGVAFVEILGDTSQLDRKVQQSISGAVSDLKSIPDAQIGADTNRATSAVDRAVGDIDASISGIPDVTVDGDFSAISRGEGTIDGIDSAIKGIPDIELDDNFDEVEQGADSAADGVTAAFGAGLKPGVKTGAAAAGALGAAALGAAFTQAISLEKADDVLAAQLGLSGKKAEKAGEIAGNLYRDAYGDSIEQVEATFSDVYRNIGALGDKQIEQATKKSLDLTTAFGAESAEVTRTVGALIKNGLAKNVGDAFDLITVGFQKGADKGGEFLDTLNEYAEPVKSLGLNAKDFTNQIVQGLDNGVYSADKIGDAIKEFSIRAVDGSDATSTAFQSLGLDAEDMAARFAEGGPAAKKAFSETIQALGSLKSPLEQERAGVALFGSMWEDIGKKAILGLDPAVDHLGKVDGAAKQLDKTLNDNLGTRLEEIKRKAFGELVKFIEQTALPAISDFVDAIDLGPAATDAVQSIKRIYEQLKGPLSTAFKIIAPIVEASFGTVIQVIKTGLKLAADIIDVFAKVLKGDWGGAWDAIKKLVQDALKGVLDILDTFTKPVQDLAKKIGNGIVDGFSFIKDIPGKIAGWLGTGIETLAKKATELGSTIVSGVATGLGDLLSTVGGFIGGIPGKVGEFFEDIGKKAEGLGKKIINGIKNALKTGLLATIGDFMRHIPGKIGDFFEDIFNKAVKLGEKIVAGAKNGLGDLLSTIGGFIKDIPNKIGDSFTDIFDKAVKIGEKIIGGAKSALSGAGDAALGLLGVIGGFISGIPGKIQSIIDVGNIATKAAKLGTEIVTNAGTALVDFGETIGSKIVEGIKNLPGLFKTVVNKIIDAINSKFPDKIPGPGPLPDISLPDIPHIATGVTNFRGGLALVGEEGPELVTLPKGSDVLPARPTAELFGEPRSLDIAPTVGGNTYIAEIDLGGGVKRVVELAFRERDRAANQTYRASVVA